jgi:hypothetical protein
MPPLHMGMTSGDQQPAIRAQYAYPQSTAAPAQLPSSSTALTGGAEHNLHIPRYIEDEHGRPAKGPRHAGHSSIHSAGSLTNNDASEYRYGPGSYVPVNNPSSSDLAGSTYPSTDTATGGSGQSQPPRDYYPSSNTWTTTAGETSATVATYPAAGDRSYSYSEQYKAAQNMPPLRTDTGQTAATYGSSLSHYSWSPT